MPFSKDCCFLIQYYNKSILKMGNSSKSQSKETIQSPPAKKCHKKNNMSEYQDQIVIKHEDLFRIEGKRLKEKLHRSLGAITFLDRYKRFGHGSGVVISEDTILTAAHNIYSKEQGREYSGFKFYIACDGVANKFYEVQSWRYPQQFKNCQISQKLQFDYAVMKLKKPIEFDEYLPLSLPCQKCQDNQKYLSLFGYPSGYGNFSHFDEKGKKLRLYQYGLTRNNRIVMFDAARFKIGYGVSTYPGHSGSPVVVEDAIIAIHVGGEKGQFNVGRIIDAGLVANMNRWRQQLRTVAFSIEDKKVCPHFNEICGTLKFKLDLSNSKFKNLNLNKYQNFLELNLSNNKLQSLKLSHCPLLTNLYLNNNQLTSINLASNIYLARLNLNSNKLQKLNLSANSQLAWLDAGKNKIKEVDLLDNRKLTELWLNHNKIRTIQLDNNTELIRLDLSKNKLTSISTKNLSKLKLLDVQKCELSQIDVSYNPSLKGLFLRHNKLKTIDLRNNIKLKKLWLNFNELTYIMLTIAGNVVMNKYMEKDEFGYENFSFSSQKEKSKCKIVIRCDQEAKDKAQQVAYDWSNKYGFTVELA